MKRQIVAAVVFGFATNLIPISARADDSVVLVCTEIPMPAAIATPISTDPLFQEAPLRNYASLVNAKAHAFKKDVYFVTCIGKDMPPGSARYKQACAILALSFGQWIENGTGRGGQRFVWRTWDCADVLNLPA